MHHSIKLPRSHGFQEVLGRILQQIGLFVRRNAVLTIAASLALCTAVIVPPDLEYLTYFDTRTLTCLFCTLAMVCALRNIRFFTCIAEKIVAVTKNLRLSVLALVYITFLGSMLIANDMALLTFLPLGYIVLHATGKEKYMAFVFILQNIAANLGGMLTPFGNPQNLFLYSYFAIPTPEFMRVMLLPFLLSVAMITVCCLFFPKEVLKIDTSGIRLPVDRTALYLILFAFSIAIVFRVIPYWTGLIVIPLALMFLDRNALAQVDYPLLFTFVCFFIFSGNMSRIPFVQNFMAELLSGSVLTVSALSCQCISNVPSAILLSRFTDNWRELLLGVNIGGAGTIIASLASLITFREYMAHNPDKAGSYMLKFSLVNFSFLGILLAACLLFLQLGMI
ncbi:MAG: citrate transporter [Ruminococcaceae bacterium]|nr:citrate transporter [Oscillospiraceae bacterium]